MVSTAHAARTIGLCGAALCATGCAQDYGEITVVAATAGSSATSTSTGAGGDGTGGVGAATGSNGGGGSGGAAGASGGGSTGGGSPCGNGVVDPGEECDASPGDPYCNACSVVCDPPAAKDPASGKCYLFQLGIYDWFASQLSCFAWRPGSDLAVIESAQENTFLTNLVTSHAFIGGRDDSGNDAFVWVTGTPVAPDFAPWGVGQPNQGFEDCLALHGADGPFTWHDVKCANGSVTHYLCEWPLH